jgi:hypothetical protein
MFHALEKVLKNVFDKSHFTRWFPICIAVCSALALFPLTFSSSDLSVIFYAFVTVPLVCLLLCILAFKSRGTQRIAMFSTFAAFLIFTGMLITHFLAMRDAVRWFAYGRVLKWEVLQQPEPMDASLRHVEWEGWGFAGSDTTVYLVFDPKNALATAAKNRTSGKLGALPCEVYRIRQRESQWYTVQFYTQTDWDYCGI